MRVQSQVISLSWIPSDSVRGWLKAGMDLRLSHYDTPPVERLSGAEEVHQLRADDRFRFANVLTAWAEFDERGEPLRWGYEPESGVVMGSTTVRLAGVVEATFGGYALPTLRQEPVTEAGSVHFAQTVGGRTGVPLPRPVPHPPFVTWQAPIVWTTLALTLHADGSAEVGMPGASAFPRHWVYGPDGALTLKSALTDVDSWLAHSFGPRTPWGEADSEALVVAAESALERQLSEGVMRGGARPEIRRLPAGTVLTRQGEVGEEIYLVLDGVLTVEVDGADVAQVGPGAVLGERALLEGGRRTATLTSLTPVRLAVARAAGLDLEKLRAIAELHHREDAAPAV